MVGLRVQLEELVGVAGAGLGEELESLLPPPHATSEKAVERASILLFIGSSSCLIAQSSRRLKRTPRLQSLDRTFPPSDR